jgi:hypothetical protein
LGGGVTLGGRLHATRKKDMARQKQLRHGVLFFILYETNLHKTITWVFEYSYIYSEFWNMNLTKGLKYQGTAKIRHGNGEARRRLFPLM